MDDFQVRQALAERDHQEAMAERARYEAHDRYDCTGCWPQDDLPPDVPCKCTCHTATAS